MKLDLGEPVHLSRYDIWDSLRDSLWPSLSDFLRARIWLSLRSFRASLRDGLRVSLRESLKEDP